MRRNRQNPVGIAGRWAAVPAAAKQNVVPVVKRIPPRPQSRGVSLVPRPSFPAPHGFTLVELLVVITIIAILMGLLLPAVMRSRAQARIVQCINNQREIGSAIHQYETAKQHLPGYVNLVRGTQVSWVPVLFPFLGRMDLWEDDAITGIQGWRGGHNPPTIIPPATYMETLVCPEDTEATGDARLTYVVNMGLYTDVTTSPTLSGVVRPMATTNAGVFRDYYSHNPGSAYPLIPMISLSSVGSPSRTVMLSEKINPGRLWSGQYIASNLTDVANALQAFGFTWPAPILALDNTLVGVNSGVPGNPNWMPAPLLPAPPMFPNVPHPGIVVVTFCDGHVEKVAEDASCNLYLGAP